MTLIELPSGLRTTPLAFGTASLHHLSRRAAERLVRSAIELGIRHIDTAPVYGLGLAEQWLGPILAEHPQVGVTTKVGLYPRLGRARWRSGMLERKAIGRLFSPLSRPIVDGLVASARTSFDQSLRRLRRSRVERLALHEPDPALIDTDEWLRWIEDEGQRVQSFGLAGEPEQLKGFAGQWSAWPIHTRGDPRQPVDTLIAGGAKLDFTYGHLARLGGGESPQAILAAARRAWPSSAIIVSARSVAHLRALTDALE